MKLLMTLGLPLLLFVVVIAILQRAARRDADFTDFAVAGRSFGGLYQAMAFLNTWFPGTVFISSFGLIAAKGAFGFFLLPYSLLAPLIMYLMADRVWPWAARHNLRTQPDLLALRYNSRAIRPLAAVIGVISLFPWMVLGMQSMGVVFNQLSLGQLGFTSAVVAGVVVMAIRQIWTVRMGMRGVVISDLLQGFVAYGIGSLVIIGLLAWLLWSGASFAHIDPARLSLPGTATPVPLAFFSLVLSGVLGGLCWPDLFVRLYTASGVRSVKTSAAIGIPLAFVFAGGLCLLALLASQHADRQTLLLAEHRHRVPAVAARLVGFKAWAVRRQGAERGGGLRELAGAGVGQIALNDDFGLEVTDAAAERDTAPAFDAPRHVHARHLRDLVDDGVMIARPLVQEARPGRLRWRGIRPRCDGKSRWETNK